MFGHEPRDLTTWTNTIIAHLLAWAGLSAFLMMLMSGGDLW